MLNTDKYTENSVIDYLKTQSIIQESINYLYEIMVINKQGIGKNKGLDEIINTYIENHIQQFKEVNKSPINPSFQEAKMERFDGLIFNLNNILTGLTSLFNNNSILEINLITNYAIRDVNSKEVSDKNIIFKLTPNFKPDYSDDTTSQFLLKDLSCELLGGESFVEGTEFTNYSMNIYPQELLLLYKLSNMFYMNSSKKFSLYKIFTKVLNILYKYLQENYKINQDLDVVEIINESPKSPTPYLIVDLDFLNYLGQEFKLEGDDFGDLVMNLDISEMIDLDILTDYLRKNRDNNDPFTENASKLDYTYFVMPFSEYQQVFDGFYNLYVLANPDNDIIFDLALNNLPINENSFRIELNSEEDVSDLDNYKKLHTYKIFVLGEDINEYKQLSNKLNYGIEFADYKTKSTNRNIFLVSNSDIVFEKLALSPELKKLRENLYISLVLNIY